jgi:hypothetical protein
MREFLRGKSTGNGRFYAGTSRINYRSLPPTNSLAFDTAITVLFGLLSALSSAFLGRNPSAYEPYRLIPPYIWVPNAISS